MAESTFAIPTQATFADDAANDPTELDDNFDNISVSFNGSMETTTGHKHDGTDSRCVDMGSTGITAEDFMLMAFAGAFGEGSL